MSILLYFESTYQYTLGLKQQTNERNKKRRKYGLLIDVTERNSKKREEIKLMTTLTNETNGYPF